MADFTAKSDILLLVDGNLAGKLSQSGLSVTPNPPKRWAVALTPGMMGKGRRTGQADSNRWG